MNSTSRWLYFSTSSSVSSSFRDSIISISSAISFLSACNLRSSPPFSTSIFLLYSLSLWLSACWAFSNWICRSLACVISCSVICSAFELWPASASALCAIANLSWDNSVLSDNLFCSNTITRSSRSFSDEIDSLNLFVSKVDWILLDSFSHSKEAFFSINEFLSASRDKTIFSKSETIIFCISRILASSSSYFFTSISFSDISKATLFSNDLVFSSNFNDLDCIRRAAFSRFIFSFSIFKSEYIDWSSRKCFSVLVNFNNVEFSAIELLSIPCFNFSTHLTCISIISFKFFFSTSNWEILELSDSILLRKTRFISNNSSHLNLFAMLSDSLERRSSSNSVFKVLRAVFSLFNNSTAPIKCDFSSWRLIKFRFAVSYSHLICSIFAVAEDNSPLISSCRNTQSACSRDRISFCDVIVLTCSSRIHFSFSNCEKLLWNCVFSMCNESILLFKRAILSFSFTFSFVNSSFLTLRLSFIDELWLGLSAEWILSSNVLEYSTNFLFTSFKTPTLLSVCLSFSSILFLSNDIIS